MGCLLWLGSIYSTLIVHFMVYRICSVCDLQYSTVQTSVGSTHEQLTRLTPLPPVINNNSTVKNNSFFSTCGASQG